MRDAVIVEAVRSPLGKRGGALAAVHPADLGAQTLTALVDRVGFDPMIVDDVIWGCVGQVGEQAGDIGRTTALSAGWPQTVPGVSVDRACGSSQQAISFAAAVVASGQADVVVAGGVENMSRIPMGLSFTIGGNPYGGQGFSTRFHGIDPDQGQGAEMMAQRWNLSRAQLDEYSLRSHERAALAQDSGAFDAQIVPIRTPDGSFDRDAGIRRGGNLESLGALKTVFREDGVITAANASQISDGAAALLITTSEFANSQGWRPIARVHTAVVVGDDPIIMLAGPIAATKKALARSGLKLADFGAFEINEAFAPVPLVWMSELQADDKVLNPLGGAIALGHPVGGSGARLATTLVHHMRDNGIRYGLQSMCEGGGQANATIYELL
ncbi:thiolase family protein [Mycobacterium timonense]|uniref:Acetyl-CoA acetyltransferase n=1 Tax=Mycobacterium bouchedurhonense TaxID=701041 RepID=A0AAW5SAU8_MYCBC|nr:MULTISPECIES: thiolase family protein [Mycobacterium avium complex (MAC)]MCV6991657.1 thiolase family protein [Mycobacterium bouchedurhonense]MCV6998349.1 thiolase family protein [Mycobacterium timonense]ORA47414.1 acetyl-CoA acetyltransferase [Mycobacterium bouchedurhonense]